MRIKQSGISMIDVLVTIVITLVGLLGLSSLQFKASRATLDSGNRSQAVWVLEDLTNRMRSNLVAIESYATNGELRADPWCGEQAQTIKICSAHHNGSARVSAQACSATEQAQSDLYEVLCGYGVNAANNEIIFSSAADFIANPGISISLDSATGVADINLAWDVRTSGVDASGKTIYALTDSKNPDDSINLRTSISTRIHP